MSVYSKIEFSLTVLLDHWHTELYFILQQPRPSFGEVKKLHDDMLLSTWFFQQQIFWKFTCNVEVLYEDWLAYIMNVFGFL